MTDSAKTTAAPLAATGDEPKGEISVKQAAAVLQFLQRTQMQGAEMPAYVDVFNTLSAIVAAAQVEGAAS